MASTLALEQKVKGGEPRITDAVVTDALQKRVLMYDKAGEEHYNLSRRCTRACATAIPTPRLYWLASMLEAGEDGLYIARRVVRMASEDIGLADPNALDITLAARDAVDFLGMPEGNLALAQAVVYLAPLPNPMRCTSPTARSGRRRATAQDSVPLHLRNAPTGLMKAVGYGEGYQYAHDLESKVADMQCLPDNLKAGSTTIPTEEGIEKRIKARLEEIRKHKTSSPRRHGDTEKKGSENPGDSES